MNETEIRDLANRFFAAIEAGDVEGVAGCYADSAAIWHNYDRATQSRSENVEVLRGFVARTSERRYTDRELTVHSSGFSQQHLLVAKAQGGAVLELPAALFCEVGDGRIIRLREYFDPAPVAAWRERPDFA